MAVVQAQSADRKDETMKWVAVVDDNTANLNVAGQILSKNHIRVSAMRSGAALIKFIRENRPDLILLDIVMPQMTGIKLAALIKEKSPQTAIIFLTTFPQYAMDAFTVHATGYMLKPLDEKKLIEEIRYALSVRYLDRSKRIVVQTFGGFDVYVDGKIVAFKQKKCKELLALLVDKRGNSFCAGVFSASFAFYE